MRVSGFVMTDESGDVLAVSVGGSGDLLKAASCGSDMTKAAPESHEELVAEHEHLVDVLRSPDHKDDLEEAAKQEAELAEYRAEAGEEMSKAHVKGYTRKDGTYVEEHDDSRQAAQAQQPSGRFEYPSHVKNWSDKAHFLEQIPESQRTPEWKAAYKKASAQSMYGKGHSPEYKAHLAASKGGASKGGDAYGHPNVVGKADFGKESPEKGWSMKFAGTEYTATGKEGNSMHDQTPVREFESEDGHRVWADGAGRVHADSTGEVAGLRQKHEAHSGSGADDSGIEKVPHENGFKPGDKVHFPNPNKSDGSSAEGVYLGKRDGLSVISHGGREWDDNYFDLSAKPFGPKSAFSPSVGAKKQSRDHAQKAKSHYAEAKKHTGSPDTNFHLQAAMAHEKASQALLGGDGDDVKAKVSNAEKVSKLAESESGKPSSNSKKAAPGKDTAVTDASLKNHPMWSQSDFDYFKEKGYEPKEIKEIWDRDHASGHAPVTHQKAPDVVGVVSDPNHNKKSADPQEGDVGHEEFKKYGVYHRKGDKVKDNYGKTHTVAEHNGPVVRMTDGESFHPTKVHKQGGKPMAKALLFVGSKSAAAELAEMAKSHVSAYTRKDGVFVGDHERPGQFQIGDPVKVTAPVMGQGQVGEIHDTAPSGHFHIVRFPDGSKSSYHESDLSLHEDDEDEFDDDEENDR